MRSIILGALTAACLAACAGPAPEPAAPAGLGPVFSHQVAGAAMPWTHEDFDNDAASFTFAVFSDLTGGERDGVFSIAVEQLRLLRPEFIISVGDLIEGGTEDRGQLEREWASFDERAERAHAPVFYVGGNHDLINPVQWEVWDARYGKRYYHFVYRDVLFLVLDTEDNPAGRQQEIHEKRLEALRRVESEGWGVYPETEYAKMPETATGRIGAGQSEYFIEVLRRHPGVRWTFLFMHKPVWLRPQEEHFLAIETTLVERPYTVFNGHNHAYLHRSRMGRDYIQLGTTGGVQQPGKEMAVDHVTLVTVSQDGVDIANLRLSGIFDKTGKIPLNGEALCFEAAKCGN